MSSLLEEEPERQRGCKTPSESNGAGMREVSGHQLPWGWWATAGVWGFTPSEVGAIGGFG